MAQSGPPEERIGRFGRSVHETLQVVPHAHGSPIRPCEGGSGASYTSPVPENTASWVQSAAILAVVCLGAVILILVMAMVLRRKGGPRARPQSGPPGPDPWSEAARRLEDKEPQGP